MKTARRCPATPAGSRRFRPVLLSFAASFACAASVRAADLRWDSAQQFGAVAVRDRAYTAFQPDGLRLGNYLLFPTIGYATAYDDNVTGEQIKKIADWRHELSATIKFESHLPRHLLDFMTGIKAVTFQRNDHMEHIDGFATVRWRFDFDHAHSFYGYASTELTHEEELGDERPTSTRRAPQVLKTKAEAAFKRDAGRLHVAAGARYQAWDYSDATTFSGLNVDQDGRDAWILSPFVRWGFRMSPGYTLVGEVMGHHQENRGADGVDRDARGIEALAGVDFELTRLLKASLKGGYRFQDYRQANLDDISAPVWDARLQWLVSPLVTLTFGAQRSIFATTFGDSSGRLESIYSAKIEYEMWRNLLWTAEAQYRASDFVGTDRTDELYVGRIGAEYAHTKNWLFTFEYEHQNRQSSLNSFDITKNRVMLGTKLRF